MSACELSMCVCSYQNGSGRGMCSPVPQPPCGRTRRPDNCRRRRPVGTQDVDLELAIEWCFGDAAAGDVVKALHVIECGKSKCDYLRPPLPPQVSIVAVRFQNNLWTQSHGVCPAVASHNSESQHSCENQPITVAGSLRNPIINLFTTARGK